MFSDTCFVNDMVNVYLFSLDFSILASQAGLTTGKAFVVFFSEAFVEFLPGRIPLKRFLAVGLRLCTLDWFFFGVSLNPRSSKPFFPRCI